VADSTFTHEQKTSTFILDDGNDTVATRRRKRCRERGKDALTRRTGRDVVADRECPCCQSHEGSATCGGHAAVRRVITDDEYLIRRYLLVEIRGRGALYAI
jgi:hypothetical protein